jgi:hypothetical protein
MSIHGSGERVSLSHFLELRTDILTIFVAECDQWQREILTIECQKDGRAVQPRQPALRRVFETVRPIATWLGDKHDSARWQPFNCRQRSRQ